MSRADLLFELGTEELPPKSLMTLSKALELSVTKAVKGVGSRPTLKSLLTPHPDA